MGMSRWNDDGRKKTKELHAFASWKKRRRGERALFSVNTAIDITDFHGLEQLGNWELAKKKSLPAPRPGCKCTQYMFKNPHPTKKEELIMVRITECDSDDNAHEAVIDLIMESTLPRFPNGETIGLNVGDICFGSHAKIPVFILFARDNVMVSVRSVGTDPVNVETAAQKIDQIIRTGTPLGHDPMLAMKEREKPAHGKKRKKTMLKRIAAVEEKVLLAIDGFHPKDENIKCKITASGGHILREKDSFYYCPEKPGEHTINILIIDENNRLLSAVDYNVTVNEK